MAVVLALAAAAAWGTSDFVAGVAGRRSDGTSVAFASQVVGLVVLAVVAPVVQGGAGAADLTWGAAAGLGGSVGVVLLYRGLAVGVMSLVAPVTAVGASSLPVLFGLATGERPSAAALAGVVLALVAVALLCAFPAGQADDPDRREPAAGPAHHRAGLVEALGSGVGFGVFFICLARAGEGGGLWPLVSARLAAVALLGGLVLITRRAAVPERGIAPGIAVIGVLDATANVLFLLASRRGLLSLVALLTSLYPAATVLLARVVLRERMSGLQAVGLAGAGGAVALIAIG